MVARADRPEAVRCTDTGEDKPRPYDRVHQRFVVHPSDARRLGRSLYPCQVRCRRRGDRRWPNPRLPIRRPPHPAPDAILAQDEYSLPASDGVPLPDGRAQQDPLTYSRDALRYRLRHVSDRVERQLCVPPTDPSHLPHPRRPEGAIGFPGCSREAAAGECPIARQTGFAATGFVLLAVCRRCQWGSCGHGRGHSTIEGMALRTGHLWWSTTRP